jgi:cytochrome d ubiquinol oxidase subunit I
MHTPVGFEMRDGVAHATDWLAIVFNPSLPYRLSHMLLASGLTVAFLLAGLSALRWLMGQRGADVRAALKTGVVMGALLIPVQIFAGDLHGLNTLEHQPQKVAAMEGNWETGGNVPLLLFALPDEEARENRFEIGIPSGASLILKHSVDGEVPGLNDFVAEDGTPEHPPVAPVFYAFRVMVGVGMLMLAVSWFGWWQLRRGGLPGKPLLYALAGMTFSGWIATLAGWYVTEIGRQPWLVTGVLSTSEAVSDVPGVVLFGSLSAYVAVYGVLLVAYMSTLVHLARKAGKPKDGGDTRTPFPMPGLVGPNATPAE